jgi:hypothetical protein
MIGALAPAERLNSPNPCSFLQLYHGWIFAYNATTGNKINVFSTTSTTNGDRDSQAAGAVWMSGGGIAVDMNGKNALVAFCVSVPAAAPVSPAADRQTDRSTDVRPEGWFDTLREAGWRGMEWMPAAPATKE